jgi:hypothetical protein
MDDVIERARALKVTAIEARDRGEFDEARRQLGQAEGELSQALDEERRERTDDEAGVFERKLASQLVHIRGSLGGVWRRQDRHADSARAYDAGYTLERAESGYRIVDSYTLVQRLVARVLQDPAAVAHADRPVDGLRIPEELQDAARVIREQIQRKGRERDEYAAADLALVLLLLGDPDWRSQLRRFLSMTSGYAVATTREVLQDLHRVVARSPGAPTALRTGLREALSMLPTP